MPAYIRFGHRCRKFRAIHLATCQWPCSHRLAGTDEQGFMDLDAFQAAYDPHRPLSEVHSSPITPCGDKRSKHRSNRSSTETERSSSETARTENPAPSTTSSSSGSDSDGETIRTGRSDRSSHRRTFIGPVMPEPPCTTCGVDMMGTVCHECLFPSCETRVCHACARLLVQHADDNGFDGDIQALKHHYAVERGEEERDESKKVVSLKRGSTIGADWMKMILEKNRKAREFEERWGRKIGE